MADAALQYARCGWWVVPVAAGLKDPSSILGSAWGRSSSRDPGQIRAWFEQYPDAGVALDLGRSGAVAFNINDPDLAPYFVVDPFDVGGSFQRTRPDDRRFVKPGHAVYALPDGMRLPSGVYGLGLYWGNVLSDGASLMVSPSRHPDAEGIYQWQTEGAVPQLDDEVAAWLERRRDESESEKPEDPQPQAPTEPERSVVAEESGAIADTTDDLQDEGREPERSSWAPVDLSSVAEDASGTVVPAWWTRSDGPKLIYPGMVHSVFGEPETGKSLLMQALSVEVLSLGGRVLYVDFESDARSVTERLRLLGADTELLGRAFVYVRPTTGHETPADRAQWDALLTTQFDLVVLDGITEAFSLFDVTSTDNDEVTTWMRAVPKAVAERTSAAVVLVDHVVKNREAQGRFAIGAQAKLMALTGAGYRLHLRESFEPGTSGRIALEVVKDRPGQVRAASVAVDRSNSRYAADAIVDSTSGSLSVVLVPPTGSERRARGEEPDHLKDRIRQAVTAQPGMSQTALFDAVGGNKAAFTGAVNELQQEGVIRADRSGRALSYRLTDSTEASSTANATATDPPFRDRSRSRSATRHDDVPRFGRLASSMDPESEDDR
ncbi:AAA family ATPase [Ornithinimicrobium sediminis]|uniref:AAA family ATPase n=1 Tax=Ornithinimicrobium sediminis TaxID=2904603 RepID=UPI001E59C166|nr:AAA family ATPase [Ornithinimicrobium sediminis]